MVLKKQSTIKRIKTNVWDKEQRGHMERKEISVALWSSWKMHVNQGRRYVCISQKAKECLVTTWEEATGWSLIVLALLKCSYWLALGRGRWEASVISRTALVFQHGDRQSQLTIVQDSSSWLSLDVETSQWGSVLCNFGPSQNAVSRYSVKASSRCEARQSSKWHFYNKPAHLGAANCNKIVHVFASLTGRVGDASYLPDPRFSWCLGRS